jgi:hypothetical protein
MTRPKKAPTSAETIDSELDDDSEPEDSTHSSDDKMGSDSNDTDPRSVSAFLFFVILMFCLFAIYPRLVERLRKPVLTIFWMALANRRRKGKER